MREKPRILNTQTLASSRLFHIEQLHLRFSNGAEAHYERLSSQGAGAVLVVAMQDEQTLLLIREYAVGPERYELGFPKGRIEPQEDVLAAANRELMEEVGFAAGELTLLGELSLAPGYIRHHTHIVLARDLSPKTMPGDEPEEIEVIPWRLSQMGDLLAQEDFTEARSIAALFMTREYLYA